MRPITIRNTVKFMLISHSNGLAYDLVKHEGGSVFMQGDDAVQFREEFTAREKFYPEKNIDEILCELFNRYNTFEE